ncbi:hypothetical protein ACFQVD_26685 [Streptosporangium amethystogenes subsp. fukuiense]|uniref:Uncharacterized protein n=1 Tax=Streptosporangium amethystogenes subsp. fukuiense TaxID=698418 RepID=A0ABW2T7E9_9ACTN
MIRYFQTRPVEVSAIQWTGNNLSELHDLAGDCFRYTPSDAEGVAWVRTSAQVWESLSTDRWVVLDDTGALRVYTPAEFAALHEETSSAARDAAETLRRFRTFLDEDFRFWCSPNAVAAQYATQLLRILDQGGSNGR